MRADFPVPGFPEMYIDRGNEFFVLIVKKIDNKLSFSSLASITRVCLSDKIMSLLLNRRCLFWSFHIERKNAFKWSCYDSQIVEIT